MTGCYQVTTSVESEGAAALIADAIVTEKLAACAQVYGPIASVYRWQGRIERASEWICIAKTRESSLPALLERIRALHTYQQPEIVATPISAGDPGYLDWVRRESTPNPEVA
ncbi:MAG: divalent-cation tolerance protein CutA [Gemmatimonadales bacterium]